MTCASVAIGLPVATGLTLTPWSSCKASTIRLLADPVAEWATVLPAACLRLLIGELTGTYQNSETPIIDPPIRRIGAPLPNAPSAPSVPMETPTSAAPVVTAASVSPLPFV